MENIFEWMKKHKWLLGIIAILAFVLPLVVVQLIFKVNARSNFFIAAWNAGDLLGYIGAFFSFFGTVSLGVLALWQNKKANDINRRLYKLEASKQLPDITWKENRDILILSQPQQDKTYYILLPLELKNVSHNDIKVTEISCIQFDDSDEDLYPNANGYNIFEYSHSIKGSDINLSTSELCLASNSEDKMFVIIIKSEEEFDKFNMLMSVSFVCRKDNNEQHIAFEAQLYQKIDDNQMESISGNDVIVYESYYVNKTTNDFHSND